jgi:hypothetical protein
MTTPTVIPSRRVKSTSGGRRRERFHAGTEKPRANCQTTHTTFGLRPNHQKLDRSLATFSGPGGAPQTPTDSRGALLNRIAVFSTSVILSAIVTSV